MSVAERLKEERERTGLSQEAFGAVGGVKKLTQFNYESGKRSPDAEYLGAISKISVDVTYILTGVRSQPVEGSLSHREATVLDHYRNTDEVGRRAIEQTASALAQSAQKASSKKRA